MLGVEPLHQLISNLVGNAGSAISSWGVVRIKTFIEQEDRKSWIGLEVIDSGRGMSPETKARAFEPFYTTRSEAGGTGLGLALVHGIVKGAGGTIRIRDADSGGTIMSVRLPLV